MATDFQNKQLLPSIIAVTQTMNSPALWIDANGEILNANDAFVTQLGFEAKTFNRQNIFQVDPNLSLSDWQRTWKILSEHGHADFVFNQQNKEQELILANISGTLMDIGEMVCFAVLKSESCGSPAHYNDTQINGNGHSISLEEYFDRLANFKTLDEIQREYIIAALKRCNGKVSGKNGAAELLDINDKTLYSRIKKLGIEKKMIFKKSD